jgi:hypothetical protein
MARLLDGTLSRQAARAASTPGTAILARTTDRRDRTAASAGIVRRLPDVTLVGIDCCNVPRIQRALDISSAHIEFAAVKLLTSLPSRDPRRVPIPHLPSLEAYSAFCIRDLINYVQSDFALVIQHDGFVLNPTSWEDEFLRYDYLGAPWLVSEWAVNTCGFPRSLIGRQVVGNGGFSLRSRKYLQVGARLAQENALTKLHPEDDVLCVFDREKVEAAGVSFAPVSVAGRFSIEGRYRPYTAQFGFHGLEVTDISAWVREHPEWGIRLIDPTARWSRPGIQGKLRRIYAFLNGRRGGAG